MAKRTKPVDETEGQGSVLPAETVAPTDDAQTEVSEVLDTPEVPENDQDTEDDASTEETEDASEAEETEDASEAEETEDASEAEETEEVAETGEPEEVDPLDDFRMTLEQFFGHSGIGFGSKAAFAIGVLNRTVGIYPRTLREWKAAVAAHLEDL